MPKKTILVVEDEDDIQELIRYNLEKEGYKVYCAATGERALKDVHRRKPDLVLLDLMLPGVDGLTVCREIRSMKDVRRVPIIMLTAKGEEADVVAGLEVGADDYVTKPFSPRVLIARVRALFRRYAETDVRSDDEQAMLKRGPIEIDPARHQVCVAGKPVELTFTEFRVLQFLARRPGVVYTRYQIVDAVRGEDYPVTDRSVDVQIVGLRKKLGRHGRCIETVRGVGYRFKDGM